MIYQEEMKKQYNAGKADGKIEGKIEEKVNDILFVLESKGAVTANLKDRITEEENFDVLQQWFRKAIFAPSVEAFSAEM